MNSVKILLGLVVGVVTGAAAGMLLASKKGSKIRKFISRKGVDYLGSLKTKWDELLTITNSDLEYVKNEAINEVDNGKAKMEEFKNQKSHKRCLQNLNRSF
jgi:gas vesicle protein